MKIEEKLEYKKRLLSNKFLVEIPGRMVAIEKAFEEIKKINNEEIRKYFPISLIALLESSIKLLVEEKVNESDIILEKLIDNFNITKIEKEVLINLQKKEYSRGEFISLHVKINRVSDIKKILENIFDDKIEIDMKSLTKCFEYRHIIAHESPLLFNIKIEEIESMVKSIFEILEQIQSKLYEEKKYQILNKNKWPDMFKEEKVKVEISRKIFKSFMDKIIESRLSYKDIIEYQEITDKIQDNIQKLSKLINLEFEDGKLYEFLTNRVQKKIYNYLNFEIVQKGLKIEESYKLLDKLEKENPEKMEIFIEDMNQIFIEEN